jgi:hypothetical protein
MVISWSSPRPASRRVRLVNTRERLALVCRLRPAEKNRLVKKVLLERGISKQPFKKSKIEEKNVPSMCYTFF